ncbi:response regulator transcription factor [Aureibacter tunicatorum]|uniref:DNA-binding NtrC family response regulator n=1 Tax=Aureibacter tunicatorum TaxID=866807 RepID=A0AAE3XN69_9BACT|nr:response regulator [Aureibacter tunicatorum]MDR6239557.1 DNA-binding NtrC family response regulator [Aureibacter tunicatorum]BDD04034.1 response regulator [Aureibacter tunicatorum]
MKFKAFVIERDKHEAMLFKLAFGGNKYYDIEFFDSVKSLLGAVEQGPDVVILDLLEPEMHGIELIKAISKINPGTHFIILTKLCDPHVIEKAQDEGVFKYVIKGDNSMKYLKKSLKELSLVLKGKLIDS